MMLSVLNYLIFKCVLFFVLGPKPTTELHLSPVRWLKNIWRNKKEESGLSLRMLVG